MAQVGYCVPMRILNSTAFWGILIASVFIYAMSMQPSYAADVDRCANLPSVQTADRVKIDWRWKVKTDTLGDCRFIMGRPR